MEYILRKIAGKGEGWLIVNGKQKKYVVDLLRDEVERKKRDFRILADSEGYSNLVKNLSFVYFGEKNLK